MTPFLERETNITLLVTHSRELGWETLVCGGGPRLGQKEASDLLSYSSNQLAKLVYPQGKQPQGFQDLSKGKLRVVGQVEAQEKKGF